MAEPFSEVRLPQSVESMLHKICIEQRQSPPDTSVRKQLELLGEEVSLEILGMICTQKIRKSLSGFIMYLAKDYARAPTQQDIYQSPYKRSSDDCYSPVNSPIRLPQSVESMLQKICIEQCKSPADTSARKQLELLGEKVSLEILGKICTQKIRKSLSGFIMHLAKDYARAPTQQGIYRSPHRRSSDDCYSPVNSPSRLKLNTNGSTKGDPGEGGFGGLIRDERGIWLVGYYGKLDVCTSLEADFWAICRGLTIAFEKGYKDLTVETDSSSAIELLKEGSVVSSSVGSLVEDSKFLMQRCGYTIHHVLREENNSADGLAKLGANQAKPLVVLDEAPVEIRGLVIVDMVGQGNLRP